MRFYSEVILPILENVEQVMEIEELIALFWHQILDSPKCALLYKTFQTIRLTIANGIVLNCTNIDFLTANIRKK